MVLHNFSRRTLRHGAKARNYRQESGEVIAGYLNLRIISENDYRDA